MLNINEVVFKQVVMVARHSRMYT